MRRGPCTLPWPFRHCRPHPPPPLPSLPHHPQPNGWTDIDALVLPYTFDFNTPGFSRWAWGRGSE